MQGDLLVAAVAIMGNGTSISAPSGWTALETAQTGAIAQATFYHVAAAGEQGRYTFRSTQAAPLTVALQQVRGADPAAPIAGHVSQTAGVGYSETTGTLNVAGALPLAFMTQFCYGARASGYGGTSGWTGTTVVKASAGYQFVQEALTGPISSGAVNVTESWTGGDNSDQVAELIVVQPAGTQAGSGGTSGGGTSSGPIRTAQTVRAASAGSATTIAAAFSSAPPAGDLVIAAVGWMGSGIVISAPTGWTTIESVQTGAIGQTTLYHLVSGSDTGAYTFASSSQSPLTVAMHDVAGANGANPIAGHVAQSAGVGYSETTGSLSAVGALPLAFMTQFAYGNLASGYGSTPAWTGSATIQTSAGNQFVQEALVGPVSSGSTNVTESWSGGDNSDQVSELLLIAAGSGGGTSTPAPGQTSTPAPPSSAPTPAPTPAATPLATPLPTPSAAQPSGGGANVGYTYAGCPVFPGTAGGHSGGWYNTDVSGAPVESDSAALVADYTGSGGTSGGFSIMGPQYPSQEVINTPSTVTLYPIANSSWNPPTATSLPGPASVFSAGGSPGAGTNLIEAAAGSDGHYNVLATKTCQYWSSGATSFNGSSFSVWNAGLYDLTQPQPLSTSYGSVADCCGVPMVAFVIKPAELKAGVINHALGWISPGNEGGISPVDPNRYVSPAVEAQGGMGCTTPTPCMPYGAHIRLKASFDDSGFSPSAKAVAEALKHYGAYLMDTGCCLGIAYLAQDWSGIDVNAYWSSNDDSFLQRITMHDMDVIGPANSNAPN